MLKSEKTTRKKQFSCSSLRLELHSDIRKMFAAPDLIAEMLSCFADWHAYPFSSPQQRAKLCELEILLQQPNTFITFDKNGFVHRKNSLKALNNIQNLLSRLQADFETQTPSLFKEIVQSIVNVKQVYANFSERISNITDENLPTLATPRIQFQSKKLGFYYLEPEAAKEFSKGFPSQQKNLPQHEPGNIEKKWWIHTVFAFGETHYKVCSHSIKERWSRPGIEAMNHYISQLFSEPTLTPTELIFLQRIEKTSDNTIRVEKLPIIASKTAPGELFERLLTENPKWNQQIDPINYSRHLVIALLTNPSDGKASNFMAKLEADKHFLTGFDTEESNSPTLIRSARGSHFVNFKSIIPFLPNINDPVPESIIREILSQEPILFVLHQLKKIVLQNQSYHREATHASQKMLENLGIPIRLNRHMPTELFVKLTKLQILFKSKRAVTNNDMFKALFDIESAFYSHYRKQCDHDALKAYNDAFFEKAESLELLWDKLEFEGDKENLWKSLQNTTHITRQPEHVSIESACSTLIKSLDFSKLSPDVQRKVLFLLFSDFPELTNLTLSNCQGFNNNFLANSRDCLSKLSNITLLNCTSVDVATFHTLLVRHPNLSITLQGSIGFNVAQLLEIAKYCSRFYVQLSSCMTHQVSDGSRTFLESLVATQHADINGKISPRYRAVSVSEYRRSRRISTQLDLSCLPPMKKISSSLPTSPVAKRETKFSHTSESALSSHVCLSSSHGPERRRDRRSGIDDTPFFIKASKSAETDKRRTKIKSNPTQEKLKSKSPRGRFFSQRLTNKTTRDHKISSNDSSSSGQSHDSSSIEVLYRNGNDARDNYRVTT